MTPTKQRKNMVSCLILDYILLYLMIVINVGPMYLTSCVLQLENSYDESYDSQGKNTTTKMM